MSRKRITRKVLDDFDTPTINPPHQIARVLGSRGQNLHEVEWANGKTTLATLPPKFRNFIWVKRGHFVVIDPTTGVTEKIGGDIVHVLYPEHIKVLKSNGSWPAEFSNESPEISKFNRDSEGAKYNDRHDRQSSDDNDNTAGEDDDDLFVNSNRPTMAESDSEGE